MGQLDKRQLLWGTILGIVTFTLMVVSYNLGSRHGEERASEKESSEEILSEITEINQDEVYIYIEEGCSDFNSKRTDVREYCVEYKDEESAFDIMKRLGEESDEFNFEYNDSEFGVFITGINGREAKEDEEFWSFLVNEEMSTVGVSGYSIKLNDNLGFKIEEIEF